MNIPASIDLEELYKGGVSEAEGSKRLKKFADQYYAELIDNKGYINTMVCMLKGKINEQLQERRKTSYEAIVRLCLTSDYKDVCEYDKELLHFTTAVRIYQLEKDYKKTIFDCFEYIDEFSKIFYQMVFYFRRIQLRMSKPVIKECFTFIRTMRISTCAVAIMLLDSNIGNKENVFMELAGLYREFGLPQDAMYILDFAIENTREDYRNAFITLKNSIKEEL